MDFIKKIIKKTTKRLYGKEISKFSSDKLKNIKVISFDVFDTVLVRNCCNPTEVFDWVELIYKKRTGIDLGGHYRKCRIDAEIQARQYKKEREISFDEIFEYLPLNLKNKIDELKSIELWVENIICQKNNEISALYDELSAKYKIVLISDMYLDVSFIEKLLNDNGIINYEKIYVSSKIGDTKRSGELFNYVIKDLGIEPYEMLHIGDNHISDYIIPKCKGLKCYLYNTYKKSIYIGRKKSNSCIEIKNKINTNEKVIYNLIKEFVIHNYNFDNKSEIIGLEVLGPVLLGFCDWLHRQVEGKNFHKIYFFSREGMLIKEAYNILYPDENTTYMYVSRMAICRSLAIYAKSYDELIFISSSLMKYVDSINDLLNILGVGNCARDISDEIDITCSLVSFENKQLLFDEIMKIGHSYFEKQNNEFLSYLKEISFEDDVAVVDIGWTGTMQVLLQKYIKNVSVHGYYVGVSDIRKGNDYKKADRNGFWFSTDTNAENVYKAKFSLTIMETLLTSHDGTLLEYYDVDKSKRFNFDIIEIDDNIVQKFNKMYATCIQFIRDIKPVFMNLSLNCESDVFFYGYNNIAIYPQKGDVDYFKDIKFVDGLKIKRITAEHNLGYYIFHIEKMYDDFNSNNAKVVWLKSLLKLNFPYYLLLRLFVNKINVKNTYRKIVENIDAKETV